MNRDLIYSHFLDRYKQIALDLFTWEGLPNHIEPRLLEQSLFEHGLFCFINDKNLGKLFLPSQYTGSLNIHYDYTKVNTLGVNYNKCFDVYDGNGEIKDNEVIICKNNDLNKPTRQILDYYIYKLVEVELSAFTNISQQKYPFLINANRDNKHSMKEAVKDIDEGKPYIIYNKDVIDLTNGIQVFNTGVPFVADKLLQYKYDIEREIFTLFGFNNNVEKKERLLTDEVNSNNEFIKCNIESMLKTRQRFCEQVNRNFNMNLSVEIKHKFTREVIKDE